MKRLLIFLLFILMCTSASGQRTSAPQNARSEYSGTGVPTRNCRPGPPWRDIYIRTTDNSEYQCTAAPNTWTKVVSGGTPGTVTSVSGTANQINVATGTTTPVLTLSSTLVAPGTVTATTSFSGPTVGVTDASSAAAGQVGEVISSEVLSGSAVALTTSTDTNVTSIPLTAGDWEARGNVCLTNVGSPTATALLAWISDVSATVPTRPNKGGMQQLLFAANTTNGTCLATGTRRFNVASTTTVYLSTMEIFSGGTSSSAYGYIEARRMR